jgi:hypothetical protein
MKDMGIKWHRGSVFWNDVVTDNNGTPEYNWSEVDGISQTLMSSPYGDMNIALTIRCVHETYAPASVTGGVSAPPDPQHLEKYKEFVRKIVERYDGDGVDDADFITSSQCIKYWQIENEPGICTNPPDGYLNSRHWNPAYTYSDLGSLFKTVYTEIKQTDPGASVLLPGFTYRALNQRTFTIASGYSGEDNYDDCGSFVEDLLGWLNDNGGDFDIFDVHFFKQYGKARDNVGSGDSAALLGDNIVWHLNLYLQFQDKPVWVTEASYMTDQAANFSDGTEADFNSWVARDTVKRYTCIFGNSAEVTKIFYWLAADPYNAQDWPTPVSIDAFETHYRGLLNRDANSKPVRYSLRQLMTKVDGKLGCAAEEDGLSPVSGRFIYRFDTGNNSVYVLWFEGSSQDFTLTFNELPASSNIKITYLDTDGSPTVDTSKYLDATKAVTLTLSNEPIYIETN